LARLTEAADMPKDSCACTHRGRSPGAQACPFLGSYYIGANRLSAFDCGGDDAGAVRQSRKWRSWISITVVLRRFCRRNWRQMEWTHTAALETHLLSGRSARNGKGPAWEITVGSGSGRRSRRGPLGVVWLWTYFVEHTKNGPVVWRTPKLLSYEGVVGRRGKKYAYEVLNFGEWETGKYAGDFAMRFSAEVRAGTRWRWCWSICRRWRRLEWWGTDEIGGFQKQRGRALLTV